VAFKLVNGIDQQQWLKMGASFIPRGFQAGQL